MFNPNDYKDEFERALYWISSDQAAEFDDFLQMPILKRKTLQRHAKSYYEIVRKIDPDSPVSIRFEHFDRFLIDIRKDGENPERLMLWLGSMQDFHLEDGLFRGPFMTWQSGFVRWCNGAAPLPEDPDLQSLIEAYRREVYDPGKEFRERCKAAEKLYMAGPRSRSSWDQYLWEIFYEEAYNCPCIFFSSHIENMLHRRWWRRNRYSVNAEQKEALLGKLAEDISLYGDAVVQNWNAVIDIDRAFAVDRMPDFDLYKAGAARAI
ncbi:hypothetical protein At1D132_45700 [Agrobacterium fabrum]|nr:hypothetical protein [Agrobacterium fabrum]AYM60577.1 hypothetical protein At1D132_45700 [Agrobacterium fabrum]